MWLHKPTSEVELRKVLAHAEPHMESKSTGWAKRYLNLEPGIIAEPGDYGYINKSNAFVKEGSIFNPSDNSLIMGKLSSIYDGVEVSNRSVTAIKSRWSGIGSRSSNGLDKKGIIEISLTDDMAPIAKDVNSNNGDVVEASYSLPVSLLRNRFNILDTRTFVEVGEKNEDILFMDGSYWHKVETIPRDSDYYIAFQKECYDLHPAILVFLYGRKMRYLSSQLQNTIAKIRPDLVGKVVVTESTSCKGYFTFKNDTRQQVGIDVFISLEKPNPASPGNTWREWKLSGDGLQGGKIWSTMDTCGKSINDITGGKDDNPSSDPGDRTVFYKAMEFIMILWHAAKQNIGTNMHGYGVRKRK
ncbi:hypothetical protein BDQ17DRAFT_1478728, partial [Cyathus striatus]